MTQKISRFSPPSTASSLNSGGVLTKATSPPIQIPEIPPFRKSEYQHSNYPPFKPSSPNTQSTSVSPPRIPEIPQYKKRSSKDLVHSEHSSHDGSHPEHQVTIGPSGGAEWMRRLKVAEQSPIHRSTDCIVSKDLGTSSDSELLKPAPSWTNVALKSEQQASTSNQTTINRIQKSLKCQTWIVFQVQVPRPCQKQQQMRSSEPQKSRQRNLGSNRSS